MHRRRRPEHVVHAYGSLLRARRVAAGLSLRDVGRAIGVSHALLATVEVGQRGPLDPQHDAALVRTLGNTTRREIDRARERSTPVQLTISNLPASQIRLVRVLVDRLRRNELGRAQIARLRDLLRTR